MAAPAKGSLGTKVTSISFEDQMWISPYRLDQNLVFDYFALFPFCYRTCNKEQLRIALTCPLDMTCLSYVIFFPYLISLAGTRVFDSRGHFCYLLVEILGALFMQTSFGWIYW